MTDNQQIDHSFTLRPMPEWTFEETKEWQRILTDPAERQRHRQWLANNNVMFANLIARCEAAGVRDQCGQDLLIAIVMTREVITHSH